MSKFELIAQDHSMKDPSRKRFNILNPQDYQRSIEELSKNQNLFDLMRKGFQLRYDVTRGLQSDELEELIQSEHGEDAQFMLKEVQKLSEGESTCLGATSGDAKKQDTTLVFGRMINDKFDILNLQATQIKKLDEQKLIACGIGAICTGVLVSSIATPIAGVIAGGSILAASSAKAIHDYQKVMPDLIYGYIFKELTDKKVFNVENDHYQI